MERWEMEEELKFEINTSPVLCSTLSRISIADQSSDMFFFEESLTIWIACSYRSLSAVIWFAVAFCSNPLELSFLDSFSVVRYLEFIVDKTAREKWKGRKERNWKSFSILFFPLICFSTLGIWNEVNYFFFREAICRWRLFSPFFTVLDGFKLPAWSCCCARFIPLDSNCIARIRRINLSALLQCSGACGWFIFCTVGESLADIKAESGAQRRSATSKIQSVRATTKLSFASVSLCSRCVFVVGENGEKREF